MLRSSPEVMACAVQFHLLPTLTLALENRWLDRWATRNTSFDESGLTSLPFGSGNVALDRLFLLSYESGFE